MTWTQFHDMHSGGGQKLSAGQIFIEAPESEAKRIFESMFHRDPHNVTCNCCGEDYSITESPTLEYATAYERGCRSVKREKEHRYLEPGDDVPEGFELSRFGGGLYGKDREKYPQGMTLDQYKKSETALFISLDDIRNKL